MTPSTDGLAACLSGWQPEPDAGWKTFMRDGNPLGSDRVGRTFAGGGHAAILGKRHSLKRVVMLGSPTDHCQLRGGGRRPGLAPPAKRHPIVTTALCMSEIQVSTGSSRRGTLLGLRALVA